MVEDIPFIYYPMWVRKGAYDPGIQGLDGCSGPPLPHIGFKLMATGKCTLVMSRSRTRLKRVKTKSARLKHPTRHPFMSLCEWSDARLRLMASTDGSGAQRRPGMMEK